MAGTMERNHSRKMNQLKLVENLNKDWKQPYIASFRKIIEDSTGKKMKARWAQHKKQFENYVLKNWTDETTGELEIPDIESWESELSWAVKDEWFTSVRGCDLMYFFSKFGTFEKFIPLTKQKKIESKPLTYLCTKCNRNVGIDHVCEE